jgi:hypothetical protein
VVKTGLIGLLNRQQDSHQPNFISEFFVDAVGDEIEMQARLLFLKELLEEHPKLLLRHRSLHAVVTKNLKPWSKEYLSIMGEQ